MAADWNGKPIEGRSEKLDSVPAAPQPKDGDVRYVEKNGGYYRQTYRQGSSAKTSGWSGQVVQKDEYDDWMKTSQDGTGMAAKDFAKAQDETNAILDPYNKGSRATKAENPGHSWNNPDDYQQGLDALKGADPSKSAQDASDPGNDMATIAGKASGASKQTAVLDAATAAGAKSPSGNAQVPSGILGALGQALTQSSPAGAAMAGVAGGLRSQFAEALKTAKDALTSTMRGNPQSIKPFDYAAAARGIQPQVQQPQQPAQPQKADPQQPAAVPMGQAATSAGVKMEKVRGVDTPTYVRGNRRIALPGDTNLQDDAAVSEAMGWANMAADFMDKDNDEEEW